MQQFLKPGKTRRFKMESSGLLLQFSQHPDRSSDFTISVLENSIEFYLEYAFIIKNINYHLFIRNSDIVVMDHYYASEKETKEAFLKQFGHKGWREGIKPSWSNFFVPDLHWVEFLLNDYKDQTVNF
jgi:hypothetical protein